MSNRATGAEYERAILAAYEAKNWGKLTDLAIEASERLLTVLGERIAVSDYEAEIAGAVAAGDVGELAAVARRLSGLVSVMVRQAATGGRRQRQVWTGPPADRLSLAGAQVLDEQRTGYVYYVQDGEAVKIGTSKNPWARIATIRTARPKAVLVAVERGSTNVEQARQHQFRKGWMSGEWFSLTPDLARLIAELSTTTIVGNQLPRPVISTEEVANIATTVVTTKQLPELLPAQSPRQVVTTVVEAITTKRENGDLEPAPIEALTAKEPGHVPPVPGTDAQLLAVAVAVELPHRPRARNATAKSNGPESIGSIISAALPAGVPGHVPGSPTTPEQRYQLERSRAGIAWGKDPANAPGYLALLEHANTVAVLPVTTSTGLRLRNLAVIEACAVASGFPTLPAWLTAQNAR